MTGAEGTHGEKRIDFIFVKGGGAELVGMETVETASWFGKAASDHRPRRRPVPASSWCKIAGNGNMPEVFRGAH